MNLQTTTQTAADEDAIRAIHQRMIDAWNAGDGRSRMRCIGRVGSGTPWARARHRGRVPAPGRRPGPPTA